MGIEENKQVAKQFIEASHIIGSPLLDELATDDFICHPLDLPIKVNKEEYKKMIDTLLPSMKDYSIEYHNIIGEDDEVIIRITVQATHVGQWMHLAPTGKRISVSEFFVFRMDNEKVAEMWVLRDTLSMFQQLGVLPPFNEIGK